MSVAADTRPESPVQAIIRVVERCFPLLSFGYIVRARL